MTDHIRAVVVDPNAPNRLSLQSVEVPVPKPAEALIRVHAISLNRGEVRNVSSAPAGARPGWDLAGVVEQAAADGTGPQAGDRVVGFIPGGAWAELAAVPTHSIATLPGDSVTYAQAATLPVAGLTALYGLDKGGNLLGKPVLITGAAGGVGHFGVQLAYAAGAIVTGHTRTAERADLVRDAGAQQVATGEDSGNSADYGPYQLILDGVGGKTLSQALTMLAKGGLYVLYGATPDVESTIDVRRFYGLGGATLYGFILFHELVAMQSQAAGIGLSRLVALIAEGILQPLIGVEAPIEQIGEVTGQLMGRGYAGKAVLHFQS